MKRWIAILCCLLCLSCVLTLCACNCGGVVDNGGNKNNDNQTGDDTGINLSTVSFGDATVTYDGSEQVLRISGTLPEGVTVRYEYWNEANNEKVSDSGVKNAATYTVRAIFSKAGCADRTLTAKLTVKEGSDGGDDVLKKLAENLTYANASRASAKATYTIVGATEDDNGSLGISLTIYDDSLGEDDILKMPYYVPVTSSNGQVNMGNKTAEIKLEGAVSGNIAATDIRKLSLDKSNFKGGKYTWENYVFKTTVTNAQAFFGVTLEAAPAEAEVTITMRPNGQPVKMEVAYNTASGNQVRITVNYSYN